MKKPILSILCFALSLSVQSCDNKTDSIKIVSNKKNPISSVLINENRSLAFLIDSLQVKQHNISIQIDKSDYILMVLNKAEILKSYRMVLGSNPKDDKRMEGDRCTPEGTFHIVSKYPHKSWRKFIWIDYPNEESKRKFKEAKSKGEIPKDAKIGGEVGIHGTPEGGDYLIDNKVNWTWGCISLNRKDVDEIYPYIKKSTEIIIEK
jgi:murein L,D-transpeptidase YafK